MAAQLSWRWRGQSRIARPAAKSASTSPGVKSRVALAANTRSLPWRAICLALVLARALPLIAFA
jgi:hypothetical protein